MVSQCIFITNTNNAILINPFSLIDSPIGVDTLNSFTNISCVLLNFQAIKGVTYYSVDPRSINSYIVCEKMDNLPVTPSKKSSEFCGSPSAHVRF